MQNLSDMPKSFNYAPVCELKELNNLFFELMPMDYKFKYSDFHYGKLLKDKDTKGFLKTEKVKETLILAKNQNIKAIYLMGAEPLIHHDFNAILRMSLKIAPVTIITQGSFINEKKARFLRKMDDESQFETIFRINFAHWEEAQNDSKRGIGSFRKSIFAVNSLLKYDFNPIISFTNVDNLDENFIFDSFKNLFKQYNFNFEAINLKIIPINKIKEDYEPKEIDFLSVDCVNSRIVTAKGIYACPSLSNDFRARVGSELGNFTKKISADTEMCQVCAKCGRKIHAHEWV